MKNNLLKSLGLKTTKNVELERNPIAFFVSDHVKNSILKSIEDVEKNIEGSITQREFINGAIDAFLEHFNLDTDLN